MSISNRVEPAWLGIDLALAIHDRQLAEHGGIAGVRDSGMLESALATTRPFAPDWVVALGGGAVLDMGKALAALIPGAELAVFDECAHAPFTSQPEAFQARLHRFLND